MKKYKSIKQLVFEYFKKNKNKLDPKDLETEILKHFPKSAWNNTHFAWYRYQISKGKYKKDFDETVGFRVNPKIKRLGDKILKQTRESIAEASGNDEVLKFKLNRWVFARLHQDEIRPKRKIKQQLWNSGIQSCQSCDRQFTSIRGVNLHRTDSALPYFIKNCELLCQSCHIEKHR